ncbi:hypothetical protein LSAT2_026073, partial [Lamellibrachia satsuma]
GTAQSSRWGTSSWRRVQSQHHSVNLLEHFLRRCHAAFHFAFPLAPGQGWLLFISHHRLKTRSILEMLMETTARAAEATADTAAGADVVAATDNMAATDLVA